MLDAIDGRARYLKLPAGTDLAHLPIGSIVEAKPPAQEKAVDRNILAATNNGIYTAVSHRAELARLAAATRRPRQMPRCAGSKRYAAAASWSAWPLASGLCRPICYRRSGSTMQRRRARH